MFTSFGSKCLLLGGTDTKLVLDRPVIQYSRRRCGRQDKPTKQFNNATNLRIFDGLFRREYQVPLFLSDR